MNLYVFIGDIDVQLYSTRNLPVLWDWHYVTYSMLVPAVLVHSHVKWTFKEHLSKLNHSTKVQLFGTHNAAFKYN